MVSKVSVKIHPYLGMRKKMHSPTSAVLAKNQDVPRYSYSQAAPKRHVRILPAACELCCLVTLLTRTDGLPTFSASLGKGLQRFPLSKSDPQDPQTSTTIQNNLPIF